ncbi:MAG TPA: hypothetical protein V6D22_06235 [Candidatus Obscuribacterales bacterium]
MLLNSGGPAFADDVQVVAAAPSSPVEAAPPPSSVAVTPSLPVEVSAPSSAPTEPARLHAPSLAQVAPASGDFMQINALSDQILKKEIDLYRLNTYFRIENGKDSPGKRWRVLFYKNVNYAGTFGGMVVNMAYNLYFRNNAQHVHVATQLSATLPRLVGKAVLILGTGYESWIEARQHGIEKQRGWNVKMVDQHAIALTEDIGNLIQRRNALISAAGLSMPEQERHMVQADTPLLSDGYRVAAGEYARLHARCVAKAYENRVTNTLTIIKKSDGDLGSDVTRVVAAVNHLGVLNPYASMNTTISGSMAVLNPLVEIAVRNITRRRSHNDISAKLDIPKIEQIANERAAIDLQRFSKDRESYAHSLAAIPSTSYPLLGSVASSHAELYGQLGNVADDMNYLLAKERETLKEHDIHSIIIHSISGGTKVARGSWLIYVGFWLHPPGKRDLPTNTPNNAFNTLAKNFNAHATAHNAWVANHNSLLTGIAAIPYVVGTGIREADLLHTTYGEIAHHTQLKAKRSVAATMLQARLTSLDSLEDQLQEEQSVHAILHKASAEQQLKTLQTTSVASANDDKQM